jgi:hypothetical protein
LNHGRRLSALRAAVAFCPVSQAARLRFLTGSMVQLCHGGPESRQPASVVVPWRKGSRSRRSHQESYPNPYHRRYPPPPSVLPPASSAQSYPQPIAPAPPRDRRPDFTDNLRPWWFLGVRGAVRAVHIRSHTPTLTIGVTTRLRFLTGSMVQLRAPLSLLRTRTANSPARTVTISRDSGALSCTIDPVRNRSRAAWDTGQNATAALRPRQAPQAPSVET